GCFPHRGRGYRRGCRTGCHVGFRSGRIRTGDAANFIRTFANIGTEQSMGLRELLILVLILAIVGVILRGLYVALRARRGQLRMALVKNIPNYDPDELTLSELPNGGARMVERSFEKVMRQNTEFSARDRAARNKQNEHAIPVLMDSVDDDDEPASQPTSQPTQERSSSVANARQAARKNVLGGRRTPPQQKPTHRPIDRIKARDAAAAAAAAATEAARARAADPLDDDYQDDLRDPLFEPLHDDLHDDGDEASTLIDSRIDDPADDIDGDSLDNTFGEFAVDA